MPRRTSSFIAIASLMFVSGACLAQPSGQQPAGGGRPAAGGQPGSQPGGPGGAGGQGGGGNLVERLMQADANGDGMLQWDEVPEQNRERIFARADTNNDKVLDKAELEAMRQRAPGRQGPGGPGGPEASLHDSMEQANRAMRTLKRSKFESLTRQQDLNAVQNLQTALIGAKGDLKSSRMSDAAKAKYKDDAAAYQRDFRKLLIDTAMESLKLELAIDAGDTAAAIKARDAIVALEEAGHTQFQPAEEDAPAGGPSGGGRGRGPNGGGGGGGGGSGEGGQPGGGGRPPR